MSKEKLNEIYKLVKETGYVQSINIYREMDNDSTKEYNLILSLGTCPFYEGDTRIKLSFYNIQDFKLGDINNFYKVFFLSYPFYDYDLHMDNQNLYVYSTLSHK